MLTFVVDDIENRTQRIDVAFFHPGFHETMKELDNIEKIRDMIVRELDYFINKTSPTHLTGGATPLGALYIDDGIKFVRVQNVREDQIDFDKTVKIAITVHEEDLKRSQLKPKDVLLTITGVTYGLAAVVPDNVDEANINQHLVKIEVDQTKIESQYLSYYLNSTICKTQMDRAVTGSTRPALDYRSIRALRIACPRDLAVQKKVCEEISKLRSLARTKIIDAKKLEAIENRLILDNLEIVIPPNSQTNVFEVQPHLLLDRIDAISHDPLYQRILKALEEGKYNARRLYKFGKLDQKTILPSEVSPLSTFRLVELDDIDGDLGVILRYREMHGIQFRNQKVVFRKGQIIISRLRYYLRKVSLVDCNIAEGLGSSELYTFECNPDVNPLFLKAILRSEAVVLQANPKATGSSRPRITRDDIESFMIPDVPYEVQQEIAKDIHDNIKRIKTLKNEAKLLIMQARKKLDTFLSHGCQQSLNLRRG